MNITKIKQKIKKYLMNITKIKQKIKKYLLQRHMPSDFDPNAYLFFNPDVLNSGVNPFLHYILYGRHESRQYKFEENTLLNIKTFNTKKPSDVEAFDIFDGSWSTSIPHVPNTGVFPGLNDPRIIYLSKQFNFKNKSCLELGPLEGAHTYMMENLGANVTAIESNIGAFLRCLILKNHFSLNAKFLHGDFSKFDYKKQKFDFILASGVLYHMSNPVKLIEDLSSSTKNLFLWTHYFDPDINKWNPALKDQINLGKWDLNTPIEFSSNSLTVRAIRQSYNESLGWSGFCGGTETYSYWLFRDDLIELLKHVGFTKIDISFDQIDHQNGPSFCIFAQK